jgi:hypothetical protein
MAHFAVQVAQPRTPLNLQQATSVESIEHQVSDYTSQLHLQNA